MATSPASSLAHIDFDLTFGALQIGTSISMLFLGIASLQTWNYFRDFPKDPVVAKCAVLAVYCTDFAHSVLLMHAVYYYTIRSSCNFRDLTLMAWSVEVSTALAGFIALIVQTYFCMRVLRITENRLLAAGCWLLALLRMAFSAGITATMARDGTLAVVHTRTFKWLVVCILGVGTVSDIAIAASICIGLLRRRTGFLESDRLVDRLVAYTIGSGLLTSIVAVLEITMYLSMDNFLWIAFFTIISKMFSNSLLASLNQRSAHRLGTFNIHRQQATKSSGTGVTVDTVVTLDSTYDATISGRDGGTLSHKVY